MSALLYLGFYRIWTKKGQCLPSGCQTQVPMMSRLLQAFGPALANIRGMAQRVTWEEMLNVMTDAEIRHRDAITLESYRWQLLEASARLSTTRLIIARPSPVLDATEEALLRPLESASADPFGRLVGEDRLPETTRRHRTG